MKVFKNKFKNRLMGAGKAGGDAEDVYLVPPQNTSLLQSTSTLKSLDLISEGPIEGLCLRNGQKADGLDLLGSVYFNDTPIKENTEKAFTSGDFDNTNVQYVDRVSQTSLNTALTNIKNNLTTYQAGTDNSRGLATLAINGITQIENEISELFANFDEYSAFMSQLGLIQFNTNGVITNSTNQVIYSNEKSPIYANFLLNGFKEERYIKADNSDTIIRIPDNIFAFAPDFSTTDTKTFDFSVFTFHRINNFIGGGIYFFYIGDEPFVQSKFLTTSLNPADRAPAILAGQNAGYDVLASTTQGINFENVAQNQVSPPRGEVMGKKLSFGVNVDNNLRLNFNNVQFKFNDGNEFQKPLDGYGEIKRDYLLNSRLIGPFIAGGDANASLAFTDQFGNSQPKAKIGLGNNDIRQDTTLTPAAPAQNFATWNTAPQTQHDAFTYTHIVYQNEVDTASPTIRIDLLRDTEATDDGTLGRSEACSLGIKFEHGFEGDTDETDIQTLLTAGTPVKNIALNQFKEIKRAAYFGLAEGAYLNAPYELTLKKNSVLKNLTVGGVIGTDLANTFNLTSTDLVFPNESWKDVNRYVKISKISFETESVLIQRDCSLASITEKINSKFYYPFSALGAVSLDARNFANIPIRTYDTKLKKVLVPSNYSPLKAGGVDKRFIDDESEYGLRNIFTFDQSTSTKNFAEAPNRIVIGTENYEIKTKVKFGDLSASTSQYIIDVQGDNYSRPGRVAIIQENNLIKAVIVNASGSPTTLSGSVSSQSSSDIFDISLKAVGTKFTLTVAVNNTALFTSSNNASRTDFTYDPSNSSGLLIGAATNVLTSGGSSTLLTDGSKVVDLKIRKNNELIHHWDGTIVSTASATNAIKDKFNGNHAGITGPAGTTEDATFEFGKNKEQIYIGNWDGCLKYAWTDNPAWILYDLLVNPVYGIRNQIDDLQDIDIFELYNIGRYCDAVDEDGFFDGLPDEQGGLEPRFSCNLLLLDSQNAFNVIGNIASIFRAVSYWAGGSFNFSIDNPKEVSGIFNNSNVFDGTFNYGDVLKQSRFTRVEVFYADKRDNFKIKKEYIEDENGIRERGLITNTQNGIGATSRSQARRVGKYVLLSNKLETEIVEFTAEQSALFLAPGDIIRIDDELKGFELNYGKVLNAGFTDDQPFIEIENSINTGNILTGESGSLYLYKKEGQTEINALYDIVKFNQSYQFGTDSDNFSGELNSEKIDTISSSFVFETKITGASLTNNSQSIKLNIEADQSNFDDISGLIPGSSFNLKLENNVNNFFKIVNVREEDHNVYKITALEHQTGKFNEVEIQDIQTIEEEYNIGVLDNTINRPSRPVGTTSVLEGSALTGEITGVIGSQETKYRVSLNFPNGYYAYKEFEKNTETSPPVTFFAFYNLNQVGRYSIETTSIKNPESSETVVDYFTIDAPEVSSEISFKDIVLKSEIDTTQNKYHSINYKTGESVSSNDFFSFFMQDENANPIYFNSPESPYVSIKLFDENNQFITGIWDKYTSNNFNLSKLKKEESINNLRNYTLGFYLYDKRNILCDTFMYSILNKAPKIQINSKTDYQDRVIFDMGIQGSLDTTAVEVYSSENNSGFAKLKIENVNANQTSYKIPVFYDEISNYNLNYYKFAAKDIIGTGEFSESVTGQIQQPTNDSSLPINQISNQIDQSLLSVYFAQFDENLQLSYSSNGGASFDFKAIENGREIGYNVMLDCSYLHSGEAQTRALSLNNFIELNISNSSSEGKTSYYKKTKKSWLDYGQKDFQISIDNQTGLEIEQVNLEIEKYYK